ncbi:PucR family transcriptional regulator [Halobacillus sp. BAB-2008]|uniref:PucR family transcriptional regulator n=1 Tax=Halobacillus sp. BAB-2008 TaxID=1246484 RepID=UPI0002A4DD13|nr:PucR family transcriptional regulator [Halobacillus sp. BAB-2008]ELK47099.1 purine degradation operon transcriptional regulator [Halobacillus sp. BAB-2008]
MKVKNVLDVPALSGSRVIAGVTGIDREVLHVNMMDAPDIARFLKQDEMLVTTAYHVRKNPAELVDLVRHMDSQGCAALGIKTKRFLQEIPGEVLGEGDSLGFPIIEIPADNSLGDIVNEILSSILDRRTNELKEALETHKRFTDHVMRGKGMEGLMRNIAETIDHPVVLLDPYAKPIAYSNVSTRLKKGIGELYFKDFSAYFPDTPFFSFSIVSDRECYSVFVVHTHEKRAGYLLVMGELHPTDHGKMLTIEQAVNVISFELVKENALKQYSKRVKNDFFFHFTEGLYHSDDEVVSRAKEFSLQREANYICAAGKVDGSLAEGSYTQNQRAIDAIYEYMEDEVIRLSSSTHLFTKGDLCVLIFEVKDTVENINAYARSSLGLVQKKIEQRFQRSLSFGVSNIARGLLQVKNAFKEAERAMKTGTLAGKHGFIQLYQTKDIEELLRIIPREDLQEFCAHSLKPLLSRGMDKEETLLQTLFVFLETHCQISETAKRLYVHRNTVVYRLEKCEELLGERVSDSEVTIRLRLALRIRHLLEAPEFSYYD